jgi:hypothetical protein
MIKIDIPELLSNTLELECVKEDNKDYLDFINYIISFDDLPASEMALDNIIAKAKDVKDDGWVDVDSVNW